MSPYLSGGHDGKVHLRDVWASSDGGKCWTEVCHVAQWEGESLQHVDFHTTLCDDFQIPPSLLLSIKS